MARIAIGGFQHETNTFAPTKAGWDSFVDADGWPALSRGEAMFPALEGANLPAAGFIAAAGDLGHLAIPLGWAATSPSAHVTADAFERMSALLLSRLAAAMDEGPVAALYLDLHGAMVTEAHEDGEGELLRRCRALLGPEVLVAASLDLHANVTPEMVRHADLLDAYRAYPHVDMAETGARVADRVSRLLREGRRPVAKAHHKLDFLVGLNWQCTLMEPSATVYARLGDLARGRGIDALGFAQGFALADIFHAGGSVFACGAEEGAVAAAVEELAGEVARREGEYGGRLWSPDEAVRHAMAGADGAAGPIVLADTQDNPGGGGNGDTVGLLEALVRHDARDAVLGLLADPRAAAAAHAGGEGAELSLALGAWSGLPDHRPFEATFVVEKLGDGAITGTGPMLGGNRLRLGPMALLRVRAGGEGVRVAVTTNKFQASDQAMFRHLGVEPAAQRVVALKSSVHFRADFQPIAADVLVVAAPGPVPADTAGLPYRNLRPGVRTAPLGPVFDPGR